jgi:curved DNA-binding protein
MNHEFKDYYAVLGVPPDADEQAIKQAYRKLARQYHPDVNPGDKQAEERFKEINEAYQALSDPERRRKYDDLRQQYQHWQQRGGTGPFNWDQWQVRPGERVYTRTVSPEDLEDLFGGAAPFSDFFSAIFGDVRDRGRPAGPRRGRDLELPVEITLAEAFHGTTRTLQLDGRRLEARIPPGVRSGSRVRLAGQGNPGVAGGPPGDLYLVVQVAPHPQFERDGDDLTIVVPVDIYTAAVGGEVRVPTLDGAVLLKIPPRTQAETVFRLRGKGMPRLERPAERGDLFARVRLVLPEELSEHELATLKELAEARRSEQARSA